jgi:hypothetical protein
MAYKVFSNGDALTGGELNTFLMNQSVISFATTAARDAALPAPLEGQLVWLEDSNKYVYRTPSAWADLLPATTQTISDKTANYTTVAGDAGSLIRSTSTAITITIANVLSVGQRIDFAQFGAGQVTFAAGAGVTLNSADSNLKTAKQYAGATVECVASGVYWLVGNLGA